MLYPIAIEKGTETTTFGVVFPDVPGCFSAGDTFEEALIMAKEAIEAHFELLAEKGQIPPVASSIDRYHDDERFTGWVWALVDVDIEPYLGGSEKKNVTLPKLLLKKIDDQVKTNPAYKDRSHFLQVAALRELSMNKKSI